MSARTAVAAIDKLAQIALEALDQGHDGLCKKAIDCLREVVKREQEDARASMEHWRIPTINDSDDKFMRHG